MTEKKKKKKILRLRKKTLYAILDNEFQRIWKSIREVYKRINNEIGDIPATISLKSLGDDLWELNVKAIDDDQYCNIKGNVSMILHMGNVFKRIYNWDKDERKEKDI